MSIRNWFNITRDPEKYETWKAVHSLDIASMRAYNKTKSMDDYRESWAATAMRLRLEERDLEAGIIEKSLRPGGRLHGYS